MPIFALFNFDDTGTLAQDSAAANGIQYASYFHGAQSVNGLAALDGCNDFVKLSQDPVYQMDRGTLEIQFSLSDAPQSGTQTLLSRDSIDTSVGAYRIEILENGSVVISHETATGTTTFGTDPAFANPGDTISLNYSWDQGGTGGQLNISNATSGATYCDAVPADLTMDMGAQNQPWVIGAGQTQSDPDRINDLDQHFAGTVSVFSLSDTVDNIGANTPPVAGDDAATTIGTAPVVIAVLANDADANSDPLLVTGVSASADGTVSLNADGTITFAANPGFTGDAEFTYTISDGNGGSDTGLVTVTVSPPGTVRDGIVSGTAGDDLINLAYTGDPDGDRVDNADAILAQDAPNDDRIVAGIGDDTVLAGLGNDLVDGGAGDDFLEGAVGNDSLYGGDGSDLGRGGVGDDVIDTRGGGSAPLPDQGYPGLYPSDVDPLNDLDTVFGGDGNDTITTGDDADEVDGGRGSDSIDGGIDDDTLLGGDGQDTIIGGEGSDLIDAGGGDDLVYGGLGPDFPDAVNIRDDQGDLLINNGADNIRGGTGSDTIFGLDDNDTIDGGQDDDLIDAGIDDDLVTGGTGADTITGGQGADSLFGGNDRDVIVGGSAGDLVDGNEGGDDFDTLDLTGAGPLRVDFDPTNAENGTVSFLDGTGTVTGTLTFSNIENVIPCFTPGTLIATPRGEVPVESLRAGDRVITRDNGLQEIRWVGARALSWTELHSAAHLKPVLVRQGALGNGLPERDMLVSPNHRLLVANDRTALYFDEHEVLVAAKHLLAGQGVQTVDSMGTTYIHFMCDRHEVVLSNGAWTESFQPGDLTLKGIGNAQRSEIFDLFPELKTDAGLENYAAARRTLKRHEAALLMR